LKRWAVGVVRNGILGGKFSGVRVGNLSERLTKAVSFRREVMMKEGGESQVQGL